jgi:DNA-binding IclR family transcriptional regulator
LAPSGVTKPERVCAIAWPPRSDACAYFENGERVSSSELIPGTQALTKGIQVLRAISNEGRDARFMNLLKQTGFPKPTLHRILKALMAEGLVRQDPKTGNYVLGVSFLRLAFQVLEQLDIRAVAHEEMLRLSELTHEASHLAVLDGLEVVYVDLVESRQPVGHVGRLGSVTAVHAAASGKVIAAYMQADTLERLLQNLKLPKLTKHTITSMEVLRRQFEEIRQRGYALNEEEEMDGVLGVAAPVFTLTGEVVGSIGISIPSYRYDVSKLNFYADSVMDAARLTSAKMGKLSSNS